MDAITYPCWEQRHTTLVIGASCGFYVRMQTLCTIWHICRNAICDNIVYSNIITNDSQNNVYETSMQNVITHYCKRLMHCKICILSACHCPTIVTNRRRCHGDGIYVDLFPNDNRFYCPTLMKQPFVTQKWGVMTARDMYNPLMTRGFMRSS